MSVAPCWTVTDSQPVLVRIQWLLMQVVDGRFFLYQVLQLIGHCPREIGAHSPHAAGRTSDEREERPSARSRLTRGEDSPLFAEDEKGFHVELWCGHGCLS